MKRILTSLLAVAALLTLTAFIGQPQRTWSSEKNVKWKGPALPLLGTAQDGSTACLSSITDMGGSTDATALLSCANTGEIVAAGWNQLTVDMSWVRAAGTVWIMQCDQSADVGATWGAIMNEASDGTRSIWTPTFTASVSGRQVVNRNINASRIRCRAWATNGTSSDLITLVVRLAAEVKR
jgi:hypothetical protein